MSRKPIQPAAPAGPVSAPVSEAAVPEVFAPAWPGALAVFANALASLTTFPSTPTPPVLIEAVDTARKALNAALEEVALPIVLTAVLSDEQLAAGGPPFAAISGRLEKIEAALSAQGEGGSVGLEALEARLAKAEEAVGALDGLNERLGQRFTELSDRIAAVEAAHSVSAEA